MVKMTRRCPYCGAEMSHHSYGNKIYWVCPRCGKEMATPKSAEAILNAIS